MQGNGHDRGDRDPRHSPAAEAAGLSHEHHGVQTARAATAESLIPTSEHQSAAATVDRDEPATGHAAQGVTDTAARVTSEDRAALDGVRALALHAVHETDPEATVAFEEYTWHGDAILDVVIGLHGHAHHYEISAGRAALTLRDPDILHHDLEAVIRDMRRDHERTARHGGGGHGQEAAILPSSPAVRDRDAADHDPRHSPAAEAAGLPHEHGPGGGDGGRTSGETLTSTSADQELHARVDRDEPATGHAAQGVSDTIARVDEEDRAALAHVREMAREMIHEADPEASVAFEEYTWHGDLTLDMQIGLHGHQHNYEITAGRARIVLRDHDILHHDLEAIIRDMNRPHAKSARH